MKKISILLMLVLVLFAFTGCSEDVKESSDKNNDSQFVEYGVAGLITNITVNEEDAKSGTITVEGTKDNGAMYDKAVVKVSPETKIYFNELASFDSLEVGMYVNVFFDGEVMESYPVQAKAKQINVIPEDNTEKEAD